jgi:hypothetical protein
MNKKVKILFFCMIFVASAAFSQQSTGFIKQQQALTPILFTKTIAANTLLFYKKPGKSLLPLKKNFGGATFYATSIFILRPDYYKQQLGFFCRKELQLEQFTKLPFKFRLGSMEQCDWLEGKRNNNPNR